MGPAIPEEDGVRRMDDHPQSKGVFTMPEFLGPSTDKWRGTDFHAA